jgi:protein O-mannosyl-transferase
VRKPGSGRYLLVAGLFVLALMAKPMVVTFPCVLILMDVWPLQRVQGWSLPSAAFAVPQLPPKKLVLEKLPLAALAAISSIVTLIVQRPAMKTMAAFPLSERFANAIYSYPMYLWKAIWPARLGVFYMPEGSHLSGWKVLLGLLFLATVSALVWWARAKPYLLVGWLWFLGTLVPMIGIVQVGEQGMADRYAYLPMLGIFAAVALGVADLCAGKSILSWAAVGGAVAALGALSLVTARQITTWESSYALWSHSLEITRDNFVAEDYVGFALLERGADATGDTCVDEALLHFQRAIAVNPQDAMGHLNVGFCEQAHGHLQEAAEEYKIAAEVSRSRFMKSRAYNNLGAVFEQMGDSTTARAYFQKSVEVAPDNREPVVRSGSSDRGLGAGPAPAN